MNPTMTNPLFYFLNGAACMGALVCWLFFFRYWKRTRDRLFVLFSVSFAALAIERMIFLVWHADRVENQFPIYGIRLVAFLVILGGIWDKNRARNPKTLYGG